ncbi:MAG: hypothetical protein KatS3mg051_1204 [Anaerolineae bacterium]|nr:MAG: hypothetical protein KatS3mg051_1204 [Anaerolineae bacterium]
MAKGQWFVSSGGILASLRASGQHENAARRMRRRGWYRGPFGRKRTYRVADNGRGAAMGHPGPRGCSTQRRGQPGRAHGGDSAQVAPVVRVRDSGPGPPPSSRWGAPDRGVGVAKQTNRRIKMERGTGASMRRRRTYSRLWLATSGPKNSTACPSRRPWKPSWPSTAWMEARSAGVRRPGVYRPRTAPGLPGAHAVRAGRGRGVGCIGATPAPTREQNADSASWLWPECPIGGKSRYLVPGGWLCRVGIRRSVSRWGETRRRGSRRRVAVK